MPNCMIRIYSERCPSKYPVQVRLKVTKAEGDQSRQFGLR